jgi:hypothetical protein
LPYVYIAQVKQVVKINQANLIDVRIANLCEIVLESFLVDLIIAINDYVMCSMIPFILAFTFSSLTLLQLFKNKRIKENLKISNSIHNNYKLNNTIAENIFEPSKNLETEKLKDFSIIVSQQPHLQSIKSQSASNLKLTIILMTLPIQSALFNPHYLVANNLSTI